MKSKKILIKFNKEYNYWLVNNNPHCMAKKYTREMFDAFQSQISNEVIRDISSVIYTEEQIEEKNITSIKDIKYDLLLASLDVIKHISFLLKKYITKKFTDEEKLYDFDKKIQNLFKDFYITFSYPYGKRYLELSLDIENKNKKDKEFDENISFDTSDIKNKNFNLLYVLSFADDIANGLINKIELFVYEYRLERFKKNCEKK